jgi:alpha-ketoglutarate-dependent taurine dioxygenase
MESLTASGMGKRLGRAERAILGDSTALSAELRTHGCLVIEQAFATMEEAVALLGTLGPINDAPTRRDGAVLVEARQNEEVFRSSAALPLHKDGILTGFDVTAVGIYCMAFASVKGGRTFVSDAVSALEVIDSEHMRLLQQYGMEARSVDRPGYYCEEFQDGWTWFPALRARPGESETLNIGLPHEPGERASWQVRVAGVPEAKSDEILCELKGALLREERVYYHAWECGDLLLMDNYRVMHGREAFCASRRVLANIQVLATQGVQGFAAKR